MCTRGDLGTHKYHVPCGWTQSTRASKDTVKGHHKKGICVDAKLDAFFSFFLDGIYMLISLDMWMIR